MKIGQYSLRRRLLARLAGRPAVHQGGRQPDQALRAQQRGPAAQRLPGRGRARAEARVSPLLPLGAERLAGEGARARRAEAVSRGARSSCAFVEESGRGVGRLSAPCAIGVIGAGGARLSTTRASSAICRAPAFAGFHEVARRRAPSRSPASSASRRFRRSRRCSTSCDAVTIVVPTPAHFAVAQRGARARASTLLIEKPIAATLEEADELLAIARANGRDRADGPRRALQPRGPRRAAVRRRAAVHRERSAGAVQSARRRRRRRARPDDPRHRPRAHARGRSRRRR